MAGRFVSELATERRQDPVDLIFDLVQADPHLMVAYFGASEDDAKLVYARPWVSVGSDAEAVAAEAPFDATPVHPRAYGSFARVLASYVRTDGIVTLEEAVRKMTSLPADTLRLKDRGRIVAGSWADIAVFDPAAIVDRASYTAPHQYAGGMVHVLVNGVPALRHGELTVCWLVGHFVGADRCAGRERAVP